MDNISNVFSNHMTSIAKTAKEMESDKKSQASAVAIDYLVNQLSKEMNSNKDLCTLDNKDFSNALDTVTHLIADSSASTSAQNKLAKIYNKLHPPDTTKIDKKMEGFLRIVNREVPSNAFGTSTTASNIKNILKDPENLLLFLKYSSESLRNDILASCGIDIHAKLPEGDTLLHKACEQEGSGPLVTILLQLGAKIEEKDKYGKTPLVRAINDDNLSAVKALVKGGAKIDLDGRKINYQTTEPEIEKYLKKEIVKAVTAQLLNTDENILNPPDKPGGTGFLGGMGGQAAADYARSVGTFIGLSDAFGFVGDIALPILKGRDLLMETGKAVGSHEPMKEVIKEKNQEIKKLEEKIANARGLTKEKLIQEKKQLSGDITNLRGIGKREEKNIKLEVLKKGVEYLEHDPLLGSMATVLAPTETLIKAISHGAGALTSSISIYQNWNAITDIQTKQQHLIKISTALQSTKSELEQLNQQLDSNSMEGRIVKLKLNDINQKLAHIETEKNELNSQGNWTRGATTLSTASFGLLAYGASMYFGGIQSTSLLSNVAGSLVENAPMLSTIGEFLPMVGPPLSSGIGWLYAKGTALYNKTPLTPVEKSIEEENSLKDELNKINDELQVGTVGVGWTEPPPKKGSKIYTQLTHRKQEIENELPFYEGSRKLGMIHSAFKKEVFALALDVKNNKERSQRLKSIIEESGVNVDNFEKHPTSAIIQYLTR